MALMLWSAGFRVKKGEFWGQTPQFEATPSWPTSMKSGEFRRRNCDYLSQKSRIILLSIA